MTNGTNKNWLRHCSDDRVLEFNMYIGVCEGFPCIDLVNLRDHTATTHKSDMFRKMLLRKMKAVRNKPKEIALIFIQTSE